VSTTILVFVKGTPKTTFAVFGRTPGTANPAIVSGTFRYVSQQFRASRRECFSLYCDRTRGLDRVSNSAARPRILQCDISEKQGRRNHVDAFVRGLRRENCATKSCSDSESPARNARLINFAKAQKLHNVREWSSAIMLHACYAFQSARL
jgi:hypothetical protein